MQKIFERYTYMQNNKKEIIYYILVKDIYTAVRDDTQKKFFFSGWTTKGVGRVNP